MKAAAFDYSRPATSAAACALLAGAAGMAKPIAGGQSLGPMLNLRLAQPEAVVDLSGIAAFASVRDESAAIVIGAGVTHAAIEDGLITDPTCGLLPQVASNIAYRAIRNRGTIGGSLAHADPAADWVSTMLLVDAVYLIEGKGAQREVASGDFMQAAFTTVLSDDDLLTGVRITKCSPGTKFGYYKYCRKVGEFAEAIAGVLIDPARNIKRAVIGATAGAPHLVRDIDAVLRGDEAAIAAEVRAAGCDEPYEFQMHAVALKRAVAQALT
jgi:aerobic carbon-monoxide dehydrogenase medium subunit